jgi:hypothetical protein
MENKCFKICKKYLLVLFIGYLVISCKEVGPNIDFQPSIPWLDTTYIVSPPRTVDPKNVFIEDFTGVACPNCPNAAVKLHELDSIYSLGPHKVVPITIHSSTGLFGEPYPGFEDYRIQEGLDIYQILLSGKQRFPEGDVDRKKYPTESSLLVKYLTWASYVSQQVLESSKVNIHLSVKYKSDSSNFINVRVELHYNIFSTDTNYLSVALVENNMVSPQKLPNSTIDSHYVHMHVLRDMFTPFNGVLLPLTATLVPGRLFIGEFSLPFQSKWKADNCVIVAFVHNRDSKLDVLQAEEIKLK